MIFSWLKTRRRRRLASRPFPEQWDHWIRRNVVHVAALSPDDEARLKRWIQVFHSEKYWEGCDGLTMTEEMKVTIAAMVGYMARGLGEYYFDHLQTILVYPHIVYRTDRTFEGGIVSEDPFGRIGEALKAGPVSLVWPQVLEDGRRGNPGHNVVFHEFAHVLDWSDHYLDGTPDLDSADLFERWQQTLKSEYHALVEAVRRGRSTVIDPYGATNVAEFFAVSTECFFELPHLMSARHAAWFGLLREFYKINPLDTLPSHTGPTMPIETRE
jgi:Mlc titration factor MtfA (ptsG expression regulator)